jgi:hypothetical protein
MECGCKPLPCSGGVGGELKKERLSRRQHLKACEQHKIFMSKNSLLKQEEEVLRKLT